MKKVLALILATFMMATLAACAGGGDEPAEAAGGEEAAAPEAEPAAAGDEGEAEASDGTIRIGVSFGTLQEERWQRDRDIMQAKADELGVELLIQSANSDEVLQNSQCENLITQGIDVLIVIPLNGEAASPIVESAHAAGIKVISYDRLIMNCELDYYLNFDCKRVGRLQAEYMVEQAPEGNYILIGGSPNDNNAVLMREGQMEVLQPYIDSGDITVVVDQWAMNWNPDVALKYVEEGLTANNNDIAAVLTTNDGCAGTAIQALAEQGLAGQVPVTGADCDIAAAQRIAEGLQGMTVYRRFPRLDEEAIVVATAVAKGQEPDGMVSVVDNGMIDVPTILVGGDDDGDNEYTVTKDNLMGPISDGWLVLEEVYKNVPEEEWPEA